MPITSRPDLLPFALPRAIGLPYHGRAVGGALTLPNAETIDYLEIGTGETYLVKHPLASIPVRTPAEQAYDTAHGHQWLDYAILSGANRSIGGQRLCRDAAWDTVCWLYCDEAATWIVKLVFAKVSPGVTQKITVTLQKLFGMFSDADYSMAARQLAVYTWTPLQYDGDPQPAGDAACARRITVTHSQDGAVTVVNVGAYDVPDAHSWRDTIVTEYPPSGETQYRLGMHDAIKIQLSGNGSLVAGSVGSGITATVSHLATAPQMWPGDYPLNVLYAAQQNGQITNIQFSETTEAVYSGPPWPNVGAIQTYTISGAQSFAGRTMTADYTGVFEWNGSAWINQSAEGETRLQFYRVNPAIVVFTKFNPDGTVRTAEDVITVSGATYSVLGRNFPPNWQSLTWNPATNAFWFEDEDLGANTNDAGCYV